MAFFLCFLALFTATRASGVTVSGVTDAGAPVIVSPKGPDISALPGDNITIICEAGYPLSWNYPETVDVNLTQNTRTNNGKYISELVLVNVTYMYVGEYICYTTVNIPLPPQFNTIYLYVKDNDHLLTYQHTLFVPVSGVQYSDIVLPCKPTHPDVNLSICAIGVGKLVVGDNDDVGVVRYDSKKGFILEQATMRNAGYFYCCITDGDDCIEDECPRTISVEVLKHQDHIAKPYIDDSTIQHVVVGDNVTLVCKIEVFTSVRFDLFWKGINQSDRFVTSTVQLGEHSKSQHSTGVRKLHIYNVSLDDAGNYVCEVEDHQKNKNSETVYLKVYRKNESYINLTVSDNKTIYEIRENSPLKWVIYVDAHPQANLTWLDSTDGGNEILNSSKVIVSYPNNRKEAILEIPHVRIQDRGEYRLEASNNNETKWIDLKLIVLGKPSVSPLTSVLFIENNKNMTVTCTVIGMPKPQVLWYYYPDDSNKTVDMSKKQTIINESNESITSVLKININTSGRMECLAKNKYGNDSSIAQVVLADVANGFGILPVPDLIVTGDNVTLTCRAAKHSYTNSLKWIQYRQEKGKEYELGENNFIQSGKTVRNGVTSSSYEKSLIIKNILVSDKGKYECIAFKINSTEPDRTRQNIQVREKQRPSFKENSNMNGAEHLLELGRQFQLHCEPTGVPPPIITWEKDGKPIHEKPNSTLQLRNDNATLAITKFKEELAGIYTCIARNPRNLNEKAVALATLKIKDRGSYDPKLIAGVTVVSVILLVLIIILGWKILKERRLLKEQSIAGLNRFREGAMDNINPDLPIDEQAELLPYDKKWEFPREKLKLGKQLGSGAFGVVMKAEAYDIIEGEPVTTVAVKMVKRNSDYTYIKALHSELKIMVHLGKHLNVVNLLGACTSNIIKKELLVIVEYCRFGNLHNYLLRHREEFIDQIDPKTGLIDPTIGAEILSRKDSFSTNGKVKYAALTFSGSGSDTIADYRSGPVMSVSSNSSGSETDHVSMLPTGDDDYVLSSNSAQPEWRSNYRGDYKGKVRPTCTRDLVCWAFQVARGMEYLAARKVLHGDLAARNVLLADENVVKICDFGLAKSMYKSDNYKKKGDGPLPFKWMAIESIRDRVFSTQSDVWSYGIVLWEIFSLAETPYTGMEADEKLYNKLVNGYRMEKPEHATVNIHQLMLDCWHGNPYKRPTFEELAFVLGNMLEDSVRRHYIDLNDPYMDMNAEWMQNMQSDYLSMMSAPTYGNLVSPNEDHDNDYINSPLPGSGVKVSEGNGTTGYLQMGSPSVSGDAIFSPHGSRGDENIFSFDFSHQTKSHTKDIEGCTGPELRPMLQSTTDSEAEGNPQCEIDRGTNFDRRKLPSENGVPSFANPGYQSISCISPTVDNYVNMPEQKNLVKNKGSVKHQEEPVNSFSNPSYITGVISNNPNWNNSSPPSTYLDPDLNIHGTKAESYVNLPSHNIKPNGVVF